MKKLLLLLSALLAITAGCAGNNDLNSTYDINQDRNGRDLMTKDDEKRDLNGPFTNDITRGHEMGDQNPNFVNISGGSRNDFHLDVDKARQTVSMMDNFQPGSVWITGDVMNVTVFYEGNLNDEEIDDAEAEVTQRLTRALPYYNFVVSIEEDRR